MSQDVKKNSLFEIAPEEAVFAIYYNLIVLAPIIEPFSE